MPAVKQDSNTNSNLMPQNIEAEEAVLGAILVNPEVIMKITEILKPESFYKPAHRHIYSAMVQLFNQGQNVDIVTVSEELNLNSKLEAIGGRAFVNDLAFKAITTSNIEYYARIIQDKAIKRSLISAGGEIVSYGYDMNPISQSLESAQNLIFDISTQKATKDMVSLENLVFDIYSEIEDRYENRDKFVGVPTDFYKLDQMTNGLQKSDLLILAARPSMGKTAFALNIASNVALKANIPVAIFSLEMSKEQLGKRLLCAEAEVESQRVSSGNMQRKDWDKLAVACNKLATAPIYIDDTSGVTLTDIRAKAKRLAMEHKDLGLIVIDYLQLIESARNEDRTQAISAISRGLKILARELQVPVLALSQLSRAVESRKDKRPMLSDLRESGSIEQDADIVMFIYRDDYYRDEEGESETPKVKGTEGKSEIIIAKHRNGPVGSVELLFQSNITKFKNPINTDEF